MAQCAAFISMLTPEHFPLRARDPFVFLRMSLPLSELELFITLEKTLSPKTSLNIVTETRCLMRDNAWTVLCIV